ncbi:MAG: methyltransferase domain-containing protein [Cyanobacteriota bacterium]|nr:methyltransferase domain-containing protein [Cyanobacteriota bacterium]
MARLDLESLYAHRFDGITTETKARVWKEIAFFIRQDAARLRGKKNLDSILDPACGDGEFLNACVGRASYLCGCDLRPRSKGLDPSIDYHHATFQNLEIGHKFSLIWISNLLEHLPDPESVQDFLGACKQRLADDGIIVIMGPNIKYCASDYWDFADHLLPLSHLTIIEHLAAAKLHLLECAPRFLPYSFRSRLPAHPLLTRAYLNIPMAWPVLGRQFLVRAAKTSL